MVWRRKTNTWNVLQNDERLPIYSYFLMRRFWILKQKCWNTTQVFGLEGPHFSIIWSFYKRKLSKSSHRQRIKVNGTNSVLLAWVHRGPPQFLKKGNSGLKASQVCKEGWSFGYQEKEKVLIKRKWNCKAGVQVRWRNMGR